MQSNSGIYTFELIAKLHADEWWILRCGAGRHIQMKHKTRPGKITLDMSVPFIPRGSLVSIYHQAGWIA